MDDSTPSHDELVSMFCAKDWHMFPRSFFLIYPCSEKDLLAYLCDQAHLHKAWERYDGWFYCGRAAMQKALNLKQDRQKELIKHLVGKAFISVEMRYHAKKGKRIRYFRVHLEEVYRSVARARLKGKSSGDRGSD